MNRIRRFFAAENTRTDSTGSIASVICKEPAYDELTRFSHSVMNKDNNRETADA